MTAKEAMVYEVATAMLWLALGFGIGVVCTQLDERSQETIDYAESVLRSIPYSRDPYLKEPPR